MKPTAGKMMEHCATANAGGQLSVPRDFLLQRWRLVPSIKPYYRRCRHHMHTFAHVLIELTMVDGFLLLILTSRLLESLLEHHLSVGGRTMLLSAWARVLALLMQVLLFTATPGCETGPSFVGTGHSGPYPVTLADGIPLNRSDQRTKSVR